MVGGGEKKGRPGWLPFPQPHSSLSSSPEATRESVQLPNSDQAAAYQEALAAKACDTDADVAAMGGQKG